MEFFDSIAKMLSAIVWAFVAYGFSVVVHELSHAAAALSCGIAIHRFNWGLLAASCELGLTKETEKQWARPGVRLFVASAGVLGTMLLSMGILALVLYTSPGEWETKMLILSAFITTFMTLREFVPGKDPAQDLFVCLRAIEELRNPAKAAQASD